MKYVDRTGQWYGDYDGYYDDDPPCPWWLGCPVPLDNVDINYYENKFYPDFEFEAFDFWGDDWKYYSRDDGTGSNDFPPSFDDLFDMDYNDRDGQDEKFPYPTVPIASDREPYHGFWGTVKYILTGGIENGIRYNYNGTVAGIAPMMGNPPVPAFKGNLFLKGGKYVQAMGKAKGNMTANHALQNQQYKDIVSKLNLNSKQAEQLHREISGQGYGYKEILQLAIDLFK